MEDFEIRKTLEEINRVEIIKALLRKNKEYYAKSALEYINTLEEQLKLTSVVKSLPSDDNVYDKALDYIKRNGIYTNPKLADKVFIAYKYGCYWMRRQLK